LAAAFFGAAFFAAGFLAFFASAIMNLHCVFEERINIYPPTTARIIQQRRRTGIDEFRRFPGPSPHLEMLAGKQKEGSREG
jgi:hypothetical protein